MDQRQHSCLKLGPAFQQLLGRCKVAVQQQRVQHCRQEVGRHKATCMWRGRRARLPVGGASMCWALARMDACLACCSAACSRYDAWPHAAQADGLPPTCLAQVNHCGVNHASNPVQHSARPQLRGVQQGRHARRHSRRLRIAQHAQQALRQQRAATIVTSCQGQDRVRPCCAR